MGRAQGKLKTGARDERPGPHSRDRGEALGTAGRRMVRAWSVLTCTTSIPRFLWGKTKTAKVTRRQETPFQNILYGQLKAGA